jgi:YD repeat-containing protein
MRTVTGVRQRRRIARWGSGILAGFLTASLLFMGIPPLVRGPTVHAASSPVSIGSVQGTFYANPGTGPFDTAELSSPLWTQTFSSIDFNPVSGSGVTCANTYGVTDNTRPFTDILANPDGSCSETVAQNANQSLQAGVNTLNQFEAVFLTTLTITQPGDVTFNFYSDDGWILGSGPVANGTTQPTYVSGSMVNAPSSTPAKGYTVVGSYNQASSPTQNQVTVDFPAAGTYPIEVDYTEVDGGTLILTMGTTYSTPIPAGQTTTDTYDAANELTGISYSDGTTPNVTNIIYNADGQMTGMTDGTGTSSWTYDSLNRLTQCTNGAGATVKYAYDLANNLTGITYPNGQTVTRAYNAANELTGVTDWLGHTTTFGYDPNGNRTSTAYANGTTAATTYNAANQVTTIADTGTGGTSLASFGYTRDANNQVTQVVPTGVGQSTQSYTYTSLDQLATLNSAPYTYDAANNLTALPSGATLAYNAASEITRETVGSTTTPFTYDPSGNRTQGLNPLGGTGQYTDNQANQLTQATDTSPGAVAGDLVSGGELHSVAVQTDGTVWDWSDNTYGELGNGTTTAPSPRRASRTSTTSTAWPGGGSARPWPSS